jgi:hypothetical protein
MNATYETIDQSMQSVDWNSFKAATLVPQSKAEREKMLATVWRAIRPLAVVVSATPLIKPEWRAGAQVFIGLMDAFAADTPAGTSATPDFKAGKDL